MCEHLLVLAHQRLVDHLLCLLSNPRNRHLYLHMLDSNRYADVPSPQEYSRKSTGKVGIRCNDERQTKSLNNRGPQLCLNQLSVNRNPSGYQKDNSHLNIQIQVIAIHYTSSHPSTVYHYLLILRTLTDAQFLQFQHLHQWLRDRHLSNLGTFLRLIPGQQIQTKIYMFCLLCIDFHLFYDPYFLVGSRWEAIQHSGRYHHSVSYFHLSVCHYASIFYLLCVYELSIPNSGQDGCSQYHWPNRWTSNHPNLQDNWLLHECKLSSHDHLYYFIRHLYTHSSLPARNLQNGTKGDDRLVTEELIRQNHEV